MPHTTTTTAASTVLRRRPPLRPLPAAALRLGACLLAASVHCRAARAAADAVVPLDTFVVSATRSPQDLRSTPSSVTRIDLDGLARTQVDALRAALDREPGVTVVNTGPSGGQAAVFLRGAASHQTLLVVDGVRMNDRSAAYLNFLGGAGVGGLDRLEVLRGPQGTLYGSSAMGGVILMETARARDGTGTNGSLAAHAGSFGTRGGSAAVRHGSDRLGATFSLGHQATANDRPANDFDTWNVAARLEGSPADPMLLGATYRGQWSTFEETGSRFFPAPGAVESENHLGTAYARWRASETFSTRLTAAVHRRSYTFAADWGTSSQRNTRRILDLQNTWNPAAPAEIVFGTNIERSRFAIDGVPTRDRTVAGYLSAVVRPVRDLTVTAGGRHDDFDSAGGADTWRVGLAWRPTARTKFRATLGTGFSAPGSDDRHGVPQWGQLESPGLLPEKSRGWDIGLDHSLAEGRMTASVTWFHNRFRNLFEWQLVDFNTFEGRIVNRARATTEGVELAVAARPHRALETRLAYTYLDARNTDDATRLIRRPRHALDADLTVQASRRLVVGGGVHLVADRVDSLGPAEDYTTARLFAAWSAREDLRLSVRVENALDEAYEETLGYPALPRGVFGGVEWSF